MEGNIVNMDDDMFQYTRYRAIKSFRIKPVRVRHLNEMMMDHTLEIRRSRPGMPYEPESKTTAEVFNCGNARYGILRFWAQARLDGQVFPPPCIISYPTDCKNATADIYPEIKYPAVIAVGEAQFALPLIKGYLEDNKTPMAYALGMATEGPRCLRSQLPPNKYYGSCSFKNFEESLRRDLIRDAFYVLSHNFDLGAYEGHGIPNTDNMMHHFFYILSYYVSTPVCTDDGDEIYIESTRFPSGSQFTPLVDIVLYWMLVTYGYLKTVYYLPSCKEIFGENKNTFTMK